MQSSQLEGTPSLSWVFVKLMVYNDGINFLLTLGFFAALVEATFDPEFRISRSITLGSVETDNPIARRQ